MSEELNKLARAMRDMSDMVGDHHWMAAKAVEALIKKDGEIAKRDARIVELESGQSADMFLTLTGEITQLRAELAALKAQEPVAWMYRHSIREHWHFGATRQNWWECLPLYAAPVSEAKAQGVVMPERASAIHGSHDHQSGWNACLDEVARLNAAPVQQVSVPDGFVLAKETVVEMPDGSKELGHTTIGRVGIFNSAEEVFDAIRELDLPLGWVSMTTEQLLPGWMLAAAPAAPAADAGVNDHDQ